MTSQTPPITLGELPTHSMSGRSPTNARSPEYHTDGLKKALRVPCRLRRIPPTISVTTNSRGDPRDGTSSAPVDSGSTGRSDLPVDAATRTPPPKIGPAALPAANGFFRLDRQKVAVVAREHEVESRDSLGEIVAHPDRVAHVVGP